MSTTDSYQPVPSGVTLKALREGAGFSLRGMAVAINALTSGQHTWTHGHIGKVENGIHPVTPELAGSIARVVADRMAQAAA